MLTPQAEVSCIFDSVRGSWAYFRWSPVWNCLCPLDEYHSNVDALSCAWVPPIHCVQPSPWDHSDQPFYNQSRQGLLLGHHWFTKQADPVYLFFFILFPHTVLNLTYLAPVLAVHLCRGYYCLLAVCIPCTTCKVGKSAHTRRQQTVSAMGSLWCWALLVVCLETTHHLQQFLHLQQTCKKLKFHTVYSGIASVDSNLEQDKILTTCWSSSRLSRVQVWAGNQALTCHLAITPLWFSTAISNSFLRFGKSHTVFDCNWCSSRLSMVKLKPFISQSLY